MVLQSLNPVWNEEFELVVCVHNYLTYTSCQNIMMNNHHQWYTGSKILLQQHPPVFNCGGQLT